MNQPPSIDMFTNVDMLAVAEITASWNINRDGRDAGLVDAIKDAATRYPKVMEAGVAETEAIREMQLAVGVLCAVQHQAAETLMAFVDEHAHDRKTPVIDQLDDNQCRQLMMLERLVNNPADFLMSDPDEEVDAA